MKNNVITVSAVCVGLLTTLFGTNYFLNYREMQTNELLSLSTAIALTLYCLGIYITSPKMGGKRISSLHKNY
ncbi:hypothetical protein H6G41_31240 [Tolypothrix sp. FACHB-123]|uniref:hypothetical protein n=1 Tax=Tolypothrix sp. FACHB-123 TaxID=2692868 RepID=UPI0016858F2F|nr:hypothetical protein [Tolypothrix sp. FACHB-123]MBD2359011.1 hypothetical protein [Tolypothrix sp. FACHB-123]